MLDCDSVSATCAGLFSLTSMGCNGGYECTAFQYWKEHYLMTESVYPYTGTDSNSNTCKYAEATSTMLKSQSYTRFQQDTDIEGLKTRLLTQPVVVGVAACSLFMSLSGSGIFDDDACQSVGVNHSVLMVGYGIDTNSGS